jgi:hypothetical protein
VDEYEKENGINMPKISKTKIHIGQTEHALEIFCDSNGRFTIPLPQDIAEKSRVKEVSAFSKNEVIEAYRKKIDEVFAARTKAEKQIWFKFGIHRGDFKSDRSFHDENSLRLGFAYLVIIHYEYNEQVFNYFAEEYEALGRDAVAPMRLYSGEWTIVAWTQEREQFFKKFAEKMEEMMDQIEGFTTDSKALMQAIDSKGAFLLPGAKKEDGEVVG